VAVAGRGDKERDRRDVERAKRRPDDGLDVEDLSLWLLDGSKRFRDDGGRL
jgi:hypothetical protein